MASDSHYVARLLKSPYVSVVLSVYCLISIKSSIFPVSLMLCKTIVIVDTHQHVIKGCAVKVTK